MTDLFHQHFPGIELGDDIRALLRSNQLPALNFAYAPVNTLGQQIAHPTGFYWGSMKPVFCIWRPLRCSASSTQRPFRQTRTTMSD